MKINSIPGLIALLFAFAVRGVAVSLPDDEPKPVVRHGALSSVAASVRPVPPPPPVTSEKSAASAEYLFVGFDQLAGFPFKSPGLETSSTPEAKLTSEVMDQIPDSVKKLDGRRVTVTGFMLPTKIENGLATEFLLLNSPMMCCFGVTPSTNGWIVVKMAKGVRPVQDVPLPFRGRLHVRAQWENGWLAGVYQLDGDTEPPPSS